VQLYPINELVISLYGIKHFNVFKKINLLVGINKKADTFSTAI